MLIFVGIVLTFFVLVSIVQLVTYDGYRIPASLRGYVLFGRILRVILSILAMIFLWVSI
jgi:hypothetical protein